MKKKMTLVFSFALATILVVGQAGFAQESDDNTNGWGNGMSGMMQNENMGNMMNAMNSPEGQAMMNACANFMESYGDNDEESDTEETETDI